MRKNKLGISNYGVLESVEKHIVSAKIQVLDNYITFNKDKLDLELLNSIHRFLFEDIYYEEDIRLRKIDNYDLKSINYVFELLNKLGLQGQNIDVHLISEIFKYLWDCQLFYDGNTRTLIAFLKLYIKYYQLPIEYDFNKDIHSCRSIFDVENFNKKSNMNSVNKKVLTAYN